MQKFKYLKCPKLRWITCLLLDLLLLSFIYTPSKSIIPPIPHIFLFESCFKIFISISPNKSSQDPSDGDSRKTSRSLNIRLAPMLLSLYISSRIYQCWKKCKSNIPALLRCKTPSMF